MLSGGQLARSTRWNLVGTTLPLAVAVPALPLLIHHLGTARFGLLALAFALIGYMSIFDFGLSRALTQLVASGLHSRDETLRATTWTAELLMGMFGIGAAVLLFLLAPWLVSSILHVQGPLADEATTAFRVLSVGLPTEVSSSGFRGVIEAQQRFDLSNLVRIPMAVLLYAGPLAALPFTNNLVLIFAVLVLIRMGAWAGYFVVCRKASPWMGRPCFDIQRVAPVLRLAGWMATSNFISPLLVYADRFLIAGVLSLSAVTYYAAPYDVITKALILSAAVSSVLFPAFAFSFDTDRDRAVRLFVVGSKYLLLAMVPITVVATLLARESLTVWIGPDFAAQSTLPLQLLAYGVLANGVAAIPFALIQGAGRPDVTAKIHLAELFVYLFVLWELTTHLGISGTALAWAIRVLIDMTLLYAAAWRMLGLARSIVLRQTLVFVCATSAWGVSAILPFGFAVKASLLGVAAGLFASVVVIRVMSPSERGAISSLIWTSTRAHEGTE